MRGPRAKSRGLSYAPNEQTGKTNIFPAIPPISNLCIFEIIMLDQPAILWYHTSYMEGLKMTSESGNQPPAKYMVDVG